MRPNENASGEEGVIVAGLQAETTKESGQSERNTDIAILKSRSTSTEAQRAKLLVLLRNGPQTTYSLRKQGVAQCAARIWELRQEGFVISMDRVTAIDSDGFGHVRVARYSLIGERQCTEAAGINADNAKLRPRQSTLRGEG